MQYSQNLPVSLSLMDTELTSYHNKSTSLPIQVLSMSSPPPPPPPPPPAFDDSESSEKHTLPKFQSENLFENPEQITSQSVMTDTHSYELPLYASENVKNSIEGKYIHEYIQYHYDRLLNLSSIE